MATILAYDIEGPDENLSLAGRREVAEFLTRTGFGNATGARLQNGRLCDGTWQTLPARTMRWYLEIFLEHTKLSDYERERRGNAVAERLEQLRTT